MDAARISSKKAELLCSICNKIVREPIYLPCHCTICDIHLTDTSVQNGLIPCVTCGDKFVVKSIEYKVNKLAKCILDKEEHLSSEEKIIKSAINSVFAQFTQLYDIFKQENAASYWNHSMKNRDKFFFY